MRHFILWRYSSLPPSKLTYDRKNQQVYYQGKAETHTYHPLDFLAYVSLHIPDKGEQIVRYYGWYSNKSRGLRKAVLALSEAKKDSPASLTISPADEDLTHYQKKCRSAWARLIRKIYEVEPLVCPQCQHTMRIITFIGSDAIIQKILKRLGLWETRSHSPPPSWAYEKTIYADEPTSSVYV